MSSALAVQPEPAPVVKVSKPRLTGSLLLASGCTVLLLAPLAFGAVEPWSIFALEACSMMVLVAWGFRHWVNRQSEITDNALYLPMAAFFALAVVQWLTGATAYRHATYAQILLYAAYGMLAFVITQSFRRSSQFDWVMKAVTGYGAVLASFAILGGITPNSKLYWIWPSQQGGAIYGPYVNHNHYAGLMEMLTPFPLVLAATRFTEGNRKILVMSIAALMAGSIFLSGSRGGMLALVAQIVVLGVFVLRSQKGNWRQPLMLGGFLVLVIGFLVWVGGNELTRRLVSIHTEAHTELTGGTRLTIDRDCLHMFLRKPVLGWGLGTFSTVYPGFRSFFSTFFVNEAHNDYLQLLVETGLAGFAIAIWFLVLLLRQAATKLKDWNQTTTGALTAAALLGCLGILVHSFLDFNLQIPANAALFYVLCGIAASPPLHESQRRRVHRRRHSFVEQPRPENSPS
ncbi:MAG: O-antigen ligase family protein [Terriglobales bacterium]